MLGGLLLRLLLTTALCPGLVGTVLVQNLHLCEGYVGPDGRYHPGFYCPRLTDPAGHRYCCRPSPHALKSCCSQLALEALTGVNLSSLAGPGLLRNPLALPFVGLYGLLVLLLMAVDLFHFYRTQRCRLSHLLPRVRCPPSGPPGGHQPRSRPPRSSRAPRGLLPPCRTPGPMPPGRLC
ncbi:protein shisa-like-1 [Grus americana]|uniref:protein shisa-like-1 n=1 Tax=Grus americana TaxID=9117 RepID=UPI00240823EC|nr:protein shisa-like-1 [Grus americana]